MCKRDPDSSRWTKQQTVTAGWTETQQTVLWPPSLSCNAGQCLDESSMCAAGLIHLVVAEEQRAADGSYSASRQSEVILTSKLWPAVNSHTCFLLAYILLYNFLFEFLTICITVSVHHFILNHFDTYTCLMWNSSSNKNFFIILLPLIICTHIRYVCSLNFCQFKDHEKDETKINTFASVVNLSNTEQNVSLLHNGDLIKKWLQIQKVYYLIVIFWTEYCSEVTRH